MNHVGGPPTEHRILEAAVRLFSRNGFNGSTTREIARIADVNEATLFRYFPQKTHLFWAAFERTLAPLRISRKLREELEADRDLRAVLPPVFVFLVQTLSDHPEIARLLCLGLLDIGPGSRAAYRRHIDPVLEDISDYLLRAVNRGEIRAVDPAATAFSFLVTVAAHHNFWEFVSNEGYTERAREQAVASAIEFWLNTLLPSGYVAD